MKDDSDSEEENILDSKSFSKKKKEKSGWFFNPMQHLYLPYIIMGYLQLFFNLFMIGVMIYLLTQFIRTVQRDVDIKVEEYLTG